MSFWKEHRLYERIKPGTKVYVPRPIGAMQSGWEIVEATEESIVLKSTLGEAKDTAYLDPCFLRGVHFTDESSVTLLNN